MNNLLLPVVLSGGAGTRLWPLSRKSLPKQFVPLVPSEDGVASKSLLALTLLRAKALAGKVLSRALSELVVVRAAQLLDNLHYQRNAGLMRMYEDIQKLIKEQCADVLLVDNCPPYHPEFLRTLDIYKALRTVDGPTAAYDRDLACIHAYDHLLYYSPAYRRDLTMPEKLAYCGAKRTTFWPLALFDDGFPGWVRPIAFNEYVPMYLRTKIGINSHLRGKYTVGSYRLFDLPGSGVMQITDGSELVEDFYVPGKETETYESNDELIAKIDHFLTHPTQREAIARAGYHRVMSGHRIGQRLRQLGQILRPPLTGKEDAWSRSC